MPVPSTPRDGDKVSVAALIVSTGTALMSLATYYVLTTSANATSSANNNNNHNMSSSLRHFSDIASATDSTTRNTPSSSNATSNATSSSNIDSSVEVMGLREQWQQSLTTAASHDTVNTSNTYGEGDDKLTDMNNMNNKHNNPNTHNPKYDYDYEDEYEYDSEDDHNYFESDSDISYDEESRRSLLSNMADSLSKLSLLSFNQNTSTNNITNNTNNTDTNNSEECIYLDYNGTTPIDRRVFAAMIPYLTMHFGNPSSSHAYGAAPKAAIDNARLAILHLLYPNIHNMMNSNNTNNSNNSNSNSNSNSNANLEELKDSIVFTGCGTEANNMAIQLAIQSTAHRFKSNNVTTNTTSLYNKRKKQTQATAAALPHIVTSNVEHPAITECLLKLQSQNIINVTFVPVNSVGIVSSQDVISAITQNTILVTIMLANNESGAIQPIELIAPYCRNNGILFHTDAAQAVGKVSIALLDRDSSSRPSSSSSSSQNENDIDTSGGQGHSWDGISSSVDMVTIVGHKFGAPKGIACLYIRPNCLSSSSSQQSSSEPPFLSKLSSKSSSSNRQTPASYGKSGLLLLGGGQEKGRRAGTENVPYIVGMGQAATILMESISTTTTTSSSSSSIKKSMKFRYCNNNNNIKWKKNASKMNAMRNRLLYKFKIAFKDIDPLIVKENGPGGIGVGIINNSTPGTGTGTGTGNNGNHGSNGNGNKMKRLPNTLSVGFKNVHSGELLQKIQNKVACSAGSACHASGNQVSSVLLAMNVPMDYARGTLRLSVGPMTTIDEIDKAACIIVEEVKRQLNLHDS